MKNAVLVSDTGNLEDVSKEARRRVIRMIAAARSSHVACALSMTDILVALYFKIMKVNPDFPDDPERDIFLLSKGHAAAGLYAVLSLRGFFPESELDTFCMDGGHLAGHPVRNSLPGIEASTGSLGHGLSIGCGMALAAMRDNVKRRVFVLLGDGECNEGSVWEAVMFAAHHKLDNLVAVVDANKIQAFGSTEETVNLAPLAGKWSAFGWNVKETDGHNFSCILDAMSNIPFESGRPSVLIADTVKGKGVSFMENSLLWHYKSPDPEQLRLAMEELS